MSVGKRKKAISKVVKLLNLATSTNSSESIVALRHAESLIRLYSIAQRELPMLKLCDRSMLYKVSWGGAVPRFVKMSMTKTKSTDSIYQRRFSEKAALSGCSSSSGASSIELSDSTDVGGITAGNDRMKCAQKQTDAVLNGDNVINAENVFRPDVPEEKIVGGTSVLFSDDPYWLSISQKIEGFDEVEAQTKVASLKCDLILIEERLQETKTARYQREQKECQERAERARIELSFEEAIEKAFQARAEAYEAWEIEQGKKRLLYLNEEREALVSYEKAVEELARSECQLNDHVQRKRSYQAAKVMFDLRRYLALSVVSVGNSSDAYEAVIQIMVQNSLSLKDLEFSDIQNKSLFIRLLEREAAHILDVHEREQYTEEMLDKFLIARPAVTTKAPVTEMPIEQIRRLLIAANNGGRFETQKNLGQVMHLMSLHGIGVREVGYDFIKKYSVFISLINWQAECMASLAERETFTAEILEEYVQHSVHVANQSSDQLLRR